MDDSGYLNFYETPLFRPETAVSAGEIARTQVTVPVSVPVFERIEYRDREVGWRTRDLECGVLTALTGCDGCW
jgi:hypothetical protein